MTMICRPPIPPLDAFVEVLWWSHRATPYGLCEHMLPTGRCQLVIALHDAPITWAAADTPAAWHSWRSGIVHGPQSTFYRTGPKPAGAVMGAVFRPGAAFPVLGAPASDLLDRHVMLDELWGAWGCALHERLADCRSASDALRYLEQALLARIKMPLLMHPAVAHALCANPTQPIERVRKETGYSHRHFVALFRSAVGLTPKHFFAADGLSAEGRPEPVSSRRGVRNLQDPADRRALPLRSTRLRRSHADERHRTPRDP